MRREERKGYEVVNVPSVFVRDSCSVSQLQRDTWGLILHQTAVLVHVYAAIQNVKWLAEREYEAEAVVV